MYARVNTFEGKADRVDDGIRHVRERVHAQAQRIDGYKGAILLVDRESGKTIGITLWESQEKMLASEEEAARIRNEATEAMQSGKPTVERYEVAFWEVENGG